MTQRPAWTCRACSHHWPCQTRQQELVAEHLAAGAQVQLALFLASCFVEAAADLPHRPAGSLYTQFLGWHASALAQQRQPALGYRSS